MPPRGAAQDDTMVLLGTYYADSFVGRKTAAGDIFRHNQYTAAHKSIPFGTYLLVHNPYTGLEVVVKVNDRCPVKGVLDMTKLAVHTLGIKGSRKVKVVKLDEEEGYARWVAQDTLAMSYEEYLAFKDRSRVRRMTPWEQGSTNGGAKKESSTHSPHTVHTQTQHRPNTDPGSPQIRARGKGEARRDGPTGAGNAESEKTDSARVAKAERDDSVAQVPAVDDSRPKGDTYDLELCTVGSKPSAYRAIGRLPGELQKKAVVEQQPYSKQLRVVLTLSETRSHATRVQAMLIDDFPDSYLVPHHEPEKEGGK